MCHSVCNQQICENLFSINLPSLRLITILHIYMVQPYLHLVLGVSALGGVWPWGGVCSGDVSAPGGVCSGGCLLWGGCLLLGVSAPGGGCLLQGVSVPGGGVSHHALRQTPTLWTDRRL